MTHPCIPLHVRTMLGRQQVILGELALVNEDRAHAKNKPYLVCGVVLKHWRHMLVDQCSDGKIGAE